MKKLAITLSALIICNIAHAGQTERDKSWSKYTKWAYHQSKSQLGGKAKQERHCSKDTHTCTQAIYFVDKKDMKLTLPIDVYDLNGNLILRQVCKFNEELDVRTCFNWDTAKTSKEILDKDNWYLVDENIEEPKA